MKDKCIRIVHYVSILNKSYHSYADYAELIHLQEPNESDLDSIVHGRKTFGNIADDVSEIFDSINKKKDSTAVHEPIFLPSKILPTDPSSSYSRKGT